MPSKQFEQLSDEKKSAIIEACLVEFGESGVINASTNSIVKKCGISKGSLFKYFETKDDLCFYLFETVTNEMLSDLSEKMENFSTELFQKIIDYSVWETSWYIENPVKGRFVIAVAKERDSGFTEKLRERFGEKSDNVYFNLMNGIPADKFKKDSVTLSNLIRWTVEGYNSEFLAGADLKKRSLEDLKEEYMKGLSEYIEVIKSGVIK